MRAAVLEDTPDAPLLLSLPMLKSLGASLHLSDQIMDYQLIDESSKLFFNSKGQVCLRLFSFEDLDDRYHQPRTDWKIQQTIGNECKVFMLNTEESVPPCMPFAVCNEFNSGDSSCREVGDHSQLYYGDLWG